MNEAIRICNNSAILIRVLEIHVTLVWIETRILTHLAYIANGLTQLFIGC